MALQMRDHIFHLILMYQALPVIFEETGQHCTYVQLFCVWISVRCKVAFGWCSSGEMPTQSVTPVSPTFWILGPGFQVFHQHAMFRRLGIPNLGRTGSHSHTKFKAFCCVETEFITSVTIHARSTNSMGGSLHISSSKQVFRLMSFAMTTV